MSGGGGPWTPCPVFSRRPPPQTLRPPLVKLTKCVKGSGFARFKKCIKGLTWSSSSRLLFGVQQSLFRMHVILRRSGSSRLEVSSSLFILPQSRQLAEAPQWGKC